jgi:hypothetical protein
LKIFRILIYFLFAGLFSACFDTAPELKSLGEQYFVFNSFPHNKISIPYEPGDFLPWTLQVRVSDYIASGNHLYVAVNNTGIFKIPLNNPDINSFTMYENDEIFPGNTLKKLFNYNDGIYCHIYRDTFFSDKLTDRLSSPVFKLDKDNSLVSPEFIKGQNLKNWDAVDFVYNGSSWVSSWKYAGDEISGFKYFNHAIDGSSILEISEAVYRSSLTAKAAPAGSSTVLNKLLVYVLENTEDNAVTDLCIKERGSVSDKIIRYYSGAADNNTYQSVSVYKEGDDYFFTVNDKIYVIDELGNISRYNTKNLPSGCRYTGICSEGDYLYLFWEYSSFFETGNAGFTIITKKGLDKIGV